MPVKKTTDVPTSIEVANYFVRDGQHCLIASAIIPPGRTHPTGLSVAMWRAGFGGLLAPSKPLLLELDQLPVARELYDQALKVIGVIRMTMTAMPCWARAVSCRPLLRGVRTAGNGCLPGMTAVVSPPCRWQSVEP
jgi:hypothetical protein